MDFNYWTVFRKRVHGCKKIEDNSETFRCLFMSEKNLRNNLNNFSRFCAIDKEVAMGTKIPADRIYHSDKVLAGVPQLLDDFHKLIDDQESGDSRR